MNTLQQIILEAKTERITLYRPFGGQHTNGPIHSGVRISHQDLGIIIEINHGRGEMQNLEVAKLLFELAVKELLKL